MGKRFKRLTFHISSFVTEGSPSNKNRGNVAFFVVDNAQVYANIVDGRNSAPPGMYKV